MIIVECPHCTVTILVEELNCCIFRCGVYKKTGKHLEPHTPKETCDKLVIKGLIYGCGKPFKVILNENKYITEICDYV